MQIIEDVPLHRQVDLLVDQGMHLGLCREEIIREEDGGEDTDEIKDSSF